MLDLEAIRKRNEARKSIIRQIDPEHGPDFPCYDIDALIAEVERLRIELEMEA